MTFTHTGVAHKVAALFLVLGLVATMFAPAAFIQAQAAPAISINEPVVVGCGAQEITVTGSVTFQDPTSEDSLVLELDGAPTNPVVDDEGIDADPDGVSEPWSYTINVTPGDHVLEAIMYDDAVNNTNPKVSDSVEFSVPECVVENPPLERSCGLDIALVLDSSDSMSDGDIQTVKDAANGLVTALASTPVQFGVIDFDSNVVSTLNPTSNIVDVQNAINAIGHVAGTEFTNWDEALGVANGMTTSGDLVVIITDGNPTASEGAGTDLEDAVEEADSIKGDGTRILAIGIDSSGTQGGLDIDSVKAISGDQVVNFPAAITSINDVDVATGDISDLGPVLADLAAALCGGTITINKVIDQDGKLDTTDDQASGGAGWTFTLSDGENNDDYTTDENGQTVSIDVDAGSYNIVETVNDGYTLVGGSCEVDGQEIGSFDGDPYYLTVGDEDIVTCTFYNMPRPSEPELACTLTATPNPVDEGENIELSWTTTAAVSAEIDQGIGAVAVPNGAVAVSDVQNSITYTMTVYGEEEYVDQEVPVVPTATCQVTVEVDEDNGGGGSSSGSKKRSSSNDEPEPEVLGESDAQTEILPAGAPATGMGGAASTASNIPAALALITLIGSALAVRRNK